MPAGRARWPARRATRARAGLALAAALLAGAGVACRDATNRFPDLAAEGLSPYAVQMHLHGSLSEGAGSMRGHLEAARALGSVDVLWWSDHDWRIALHTYQSRFDFEAGLVDTVALPARRRDGRDAGAADTTEECRVGWAARGGIASARAGEVAVVDAPLGRGGRAARWSAAADTPRYTAVARAFFADKERAHFPLGARLTLRAALLVEELDARDGRFVVSCFLSQQPPDLRQQVLNFVAGDTTARAGDWDDDTLRVVEAPLHLPAGAWTELRIDLTREAEARGLGGADNALAEVRIGLETRNGRRATVYVDDFLIEEEIRGDSLLAWQERFVAEPAARGDSIEQLVGVEISYAAHVNYFGPAAALPDFERSPRGLSAAAAVRFAHERGGLASLNHVFGTEEYETARHGEPRARLAAVLETLTEARCHGADLIEIGYPIRALTIESYLALWDSLWCRGLPIPGTGVSDSHHNRRGWTDGNNFVTWIWARSRGRDDLLDALRLGRLAFGNPVLSRGRILLGTSDGHRMGEIVSGVDAGSRHRFRLEVADARPGWVAVPVVGGVRGAPIPLDAGAGGRAGFEAATSPGVHVRVEVRDANGVIVACTNPIAFVAARPDGVAPARQAECRGVAPAYADAP